MNKDILALKGEVGELKIALIETGVDVGPAIYLARVFDTDVDTIVKFFIFILIFVFDPMAVIFVISYNVTLQDRKEESDTADGSEKNKWWEVYGEKKEELLDVEIEADPNDLPELVEEEVIKKNNPAPDIATMDGSDDDLKTNLMDIPTRLEKGGFSRVIKK